VTYDARSSQRPEQPSLTKRVVLLATAAAFSTGIMLTAPDHAALRLVPNSASAQALPQTVPVAPQAGFADLIERVKPAVISVRVKSERVGVSDTQANPFRDNPGMQEFFRRFGMPDVPGPRGAPPQRRSVTGQGSGFFISADGYAVTNNHVVDGAQSVQVQADDNKTYTAKVVGTDQKTDLALIKIDGEKPFPFVTFSDTPPRIGDWVIAVGNPFGLTGSATAGIVSARGRDIGAGPYDDFIQIDAPINRGNSGGPAFNTAGQVIAVNTAIYSPSGGSVGIGFGIPAETVKTVVAQLQDKGRVERGWIGVRVQAVTPDIAESLGMKRAEGALVDDAQTGGPAAKAGIRSGDVITAVNKDAVLNSRDLAKKVSALPPGSNVTLDILRGGERQTITLTLQPMPADQTEKTQTGSPDRPASSSQLGLQVAPSSQVAGTDAQGLVITGIDPESAAAERGLRTGDIILNAGGKPVSAVADLTQAVAEARNQGRTSMLLRVQSGNGTRFVALPLPKA
jgi:serine protease Do